MNSIAKWELEIDTYRQTAQRRRAEAESKRQQRLKQAWKDTLRKLIQDEGVLL